MAPQVGDNDNGRLFDFVPVVERVRIGEARQRFRNLEPSLGASSDGWTSIEDYLDHRALVDAIDGLLGRVTSRKAGIDRDIVSGLARPPDAWATLGAPGAELVRVGDELTLKQFDDRIAALSDTQRRHLRIELPGPDPTDGRRILGYPAFGLYILRTSRVYLAVRCGPTGQNGRGGHDHNDQLALELMVDGKGFNSQPWNVRVYSGPGYSQRVSICHGALRSSARGA